MATTVPPQSASSNQPVPALAEPFEPASLQKSDKKNKMRGLFGLGKKKTEESPKSTSRSDPAASTASPANKLTKQPPTRRSTVASNHTMPSSPGYAISSSPRLASPAGSQIFERDVQEAALIPNSPAIPSHIMTENQIPPVLDDASQAITDDHLDPDSVEIVTHANHQSASAAVTGIPDHMTNSWQDDLASSLDAADFRPLHDQTESASNYGSLDNTDIRRLSFISFADVVQAEHQGHAGLGGSRESIHLAGLTSLSSVSGVNRSPSPVRSPVSSSGGGASPQQSKSGSVRGIEASPSRKPLASPVSTAISMSPSLSPMGVPGELNVETMTQALRRTGSGDLSGVRSIPISPIEATPAR
ncbi:hypothetical protein VSDG_05446 [Cytospora chrysosperma]|uniref:Uncharacterized protein n=1 Tax=Cytospora chrysosperma TaxID=252740 RepID=A0A423VZR2_CYTCH|nr:hypothetical protein VSDG_05446 [Valsa sordida]